MFSHAIFIKSDRHVLAGLGGDAGASGFWDQDGVKEADEDALAKAIPALESNQHVIADFDSGHLKLITDIAVGSPPMINLQGATRDIASDDSESASVTLSPQSRMREHAYNYLAEFTMELNMTEAHDLGKNLGIKLRYDTDYQPAVVSRINKYGLVEEWNRANPDKSLLVGDEIIQVNTIQWHHNTPTFVQRIIGQFKAGRKEMEGTSEMLKLYVQRPRPKESGKRFYTQRLDAHDKAFPVEFGFEIPFELVKRVLFEHYVERGNISENIYQLMGIEFNYSIDYNPLSISKIQKDGILDVYNTEHPDRIVLQGDEIVRVNAVSFHHSARQFEKRIRQKFDSFRHGRGENKTALGFAIRRPRRVHEAWKAEHPDYARQYDHEAAGKPAAEAGAAKDDDEPVIGGYEDDDQGRGEPEAAAPEDVTPEPAAPPAKAAPEDMPDMSGYEPLEAKASPEELQEQRLVERLRDRSSLEAEVRRRLEDALESDDASESSRRKVQKELDAMTRRQLERSIVALPPIPEAVEARRALERQLRLVGEEDEDDEEDDP